jgi:hypothetical protein
LQGVGECRLGSVRNTVGKICFIFDFILHIAYTVDAFAFTSILPSLSLIDTLYFRPDTKATPASVQGVGVDFEIDMDFASPQRCVTFSESNCVIPLCFQ